MQTNVILVGDALSVLRTLPDASVNCCVTSPPYFGLRDYGHPAQLGLEDTPDEYVKNLVSVFKEVRRVLCDDGTLWINIGDSYAGGGGGNYNKTGINSAGGQHITNVRNKKGWLEKAMLKQKDLIGIPWMLAFALRADGWYLRQDIIWHKPNPMPESVTDRCTKAHEYIFLMSKSDRYYYDAGAIMQPTTSRDQNVRDRERGTLNKVPGRKRMNGLVSNDYEIRNRRSVWTISTKPYKEAHFATFPPELPSLCILAGCPVNGVVLDPFLGSGTTGQAAIELGRKFVGIELNEEYAKLAEDRIAPFLMNKSLFDHA